MRKYHIQSRGMPPEFEEIVSYFLDKNEKKIEKIDEDEYVV